MIPADATAEDDPTIVYGEATAEEKAAHTSWVSGEVVYDGAIATVTVNVTDDGEGTLDVTYNGDDTLPEIKFTNGDKKEEDTGAAVRKIWEDQDNAQGMRPDSINVVLLQNSVPYTADYTLNWYTSETGEEKDSRVVKAGGPTALTKDMYICVMQNAGGEIDSVAKYYPYGAWVEGLPKVDDQGNEYYYAWMEADELPEGTAPLDQAVLDQNTLSGLGYVLDRVVCDGGMTTLVNSYAPDKTAATVLKRWEGAEEGELDEVTLTATLRRGTEAEETAEGAVDVGGRYVLPDEDFTREVELTEENRWVQTVSDLDRYALVNGEKVEYIYYWTEDEVTLPAGFVYVGSELLKAADETDEDGNVTMTFANITVLTNSRLVGEVSIPVYKTLENRAFREGDEWRFRIEETDQDGNVLDEQAHLPAVTEFAFAASDGMEEQAYAGEFGPMYYGLDDLTKDEASGKYTGTFYYRLTEVTKVNGVVNGAAHLIKVEVTYDAEAEESPWIVTCYDGDKKIDPQNTERPLDVNFVNTQGSGEGELKVEKVLNGREWRNSDTFNFTLKPLRAFVDGELKDAADVPMPAMEEGETAKTVTITSADKDEETEKYLKSFGAITYELPGVYVYEIRETVASEESGMVYDLTPRTVTVTVTEPVNPDEDGNYSYEWIITYNGRALDDETPDANVTTFTNTYSTPDTEEVEVTKKWEDNADEAQVRPEYIKLILTGMAGETEAVSRTVYLGSDEITDTWTYLFQGLPSETVDGTEIVYTVTEQLPPEWKPVMDEEGEITGWKNEGGFIYGMTITDETKTVVNHITAPELTDITVSKTWEDAYNQDGIRPDYINITLHNDKNTKKITVTVKPDDDGSWSYTFENLRVKTDDGETITYTVTEELPAGWHQSADGLTWTNEDGQAYVCDAGENGVWAVADGEAALKNTHKPEETEVEAAKVWDDSQDEDGLRPEKVTVTLYADGKKALDENGEPLTAELTADNEWKASFTALPKFKPGSQGVEVLYTIEETAVTGTADDPSVEWTQEGAVWYLNPDIKTVFYISYVEGTTVVNTHVPLKAKLRIEKTWVDTDPADRPEQLTFIVMANGEPALDKDGNVITFTLFKKDFDEDTDVWEGILNGLPAVDAEGYPIEYTAEEYLPSDSPYTPREGDPERSWLNGDVITDAVPK